jgi:hypothetical protein
MSSREGNKMNNNLTQEEVQQFLTDTTSLLSDMKAKELGNAYQAYLQSSSYVNNVEFWRWMQQNYKSSGLFDSAASLRSLTEGTRADWFLKQLQGKGYEWDWVTTQRSQFSNITSKFDLGTDPTQAGIDVTKTSLLNGKQETFQHKAYLGKKNIGLKELKNTPQDTTVVAPSEHLGKGNMGGRNQEAFQTKSEATRLRDERFKQAADGKAIPHYTPAGVAKVMGKAALVGAVIGASVEAVSSWKAYKSGAISGQQYMKEIAKTSGNMGVTGGITSGIMIPIKAAITVAGASTLVTIPIAIAVGWGVDQIVAPAFGKGKYLEGLNQMKFYQDIGDAYVDFVLACDQSQQHFQGFLANIADQERYYQRIKQDEQGVNESLVNAFKRL